MNEVRRNEVIALFLGDLLVFILALYFTLTIRFGELPSSDTFLTHVVPFSVLFILWVVISFIAGLYEKHTLGLKVKLPVLLTRVQIVNAVVSIAFFYFIPYFNIAPKVVLFIYLVVSLVLMVSWRMAIGEAFGRRSKVKALLIARKSDEVNDLYHEIQNNSRYGTVFVEWIDPTSTVGGDEIVRHVRDNKVELIVADFSDSQVHALMPILYKLIFSGVDFDDIQTLYEEVFDRVPLSLVNDTWFLENVSSRRQLIFDSVKRITDIAISAVLGVISLLFYPLVYLAIKYDDGGVLFSYQTRLGQNNKPIRIIKFRTMSIADDGGKWGKQVNKVTRAGAYLRKTRIDELPQLWNVFRGDVSLIGPRPEFGEAVNTYASEIPYYNVRHIVKPGLSGWAQIYGAHAHHGIGIEETKNKLSYDLYYIKNRSVYLDFKIALQTLKILFSFVGR